MGSKVARSFALSTPEADEGLHAGFGQVQQAAVVVAFVGAAGNPNDGLLDAVEGVPGGFHVGGFAVVDEAHAVDFTHELQAVVGVLKSGQARFNLLRAEAGDAGSQHGSQRILAVVLADERRICSTDFLALLLVEAGRMLVRSVVSAV